MLSPVEKMLRNAKLRRSGKTSEVQQEREQIEVQLEVNSHYEFTEYLKDVFF